MFYLLYEHRIFTTVSMSCRIQAPGSHMPVRSGKWCALSLVGCWCAVLATALTSIRRSVLVAAHAPTWQLRTSSQNNDLRAKRAARNADWDAMSLMVLYITHVDPAIEFETKMCGSRVVCAALIWATLQPPPSLQRCCIFCTGVTGPYKFN